MRIKTLYLGLSAIALMTLSAGILYIWLDGKQSLQKDQSLSRSKLNDTIAFFELMGSMERYLDQTEEKESTPKGEEVRRNLLENLQDLSLDGEKDKTRQKITRIIDSIHKERRALLKNNEEQEKLILSIKGLWLRIENNVTSEVRDLMAKEQELAPTLNKTLGQWSNTFPFLKEIQKKMDLTYLEKRDVSELKDMLNFSQYLGQVNQQLYRNGEELKENKIETFKKLNALPTSTSVSSQKRRNLLVVLLEKYFPLKEKLLNMQKIQKVAQENLKGLKDRLRNEEQSTLIQAWQNDVVSINQQKNVQMLKRHQLVLDGLILIAGATIIFSLIIFLKIFPNLKRLEERAHAIGKGDFGQEFTKIPKNEIGSVMDAFNHMANQIRIYLQKIKNEEEEKNKLSQSVQEMRHLSEMGEAAAKMAHELKNPLSILNFCLKDMERTIKESSETIVANDLQADLEKSLSALERLQQATQNLESKKITSSLESVDLNQLILKSTDFYKNRLEEQGVILAMKLSQSEPLMIVAPPLEFMGALTNLLNNALEYFEQEPQPQLDKLIKITTEVKDKKIFLHFGSKGTKIPDEDKVFHNFYSTKQGPLRGLGLGVVKDVVEKCQGEVTYHYEEEMNIFRLAFPFATFKS